MLHFAHAYRNFKIITGRLTGKLLWFEREHFLPVVPRLAVAEVSKVGNL